MSNCLPLLKKLGIKPKDISLYELAFIHSSFNADNNSHHHDYERLEFLGDSIIGACVSLLAFTLRKELKQGDLTKLKSSLVNTESLSKYASKLGLNEYIVYGHSFEKNDRNIKPVLEDVFEAFFGAIYLDQGYDVAFRLIKKIFTLDIKKYDPEKNKDYKSRLQEAMQSQHRKSVNYVLLKSSGPAHERTFEVAVYFEDQLLAKGIGNTKKDAEQNAASNALKKAGVF